MDKEKIERSMRLTAIEYMIAHVMNLTYQLNGLSGETIKQADESAQRMIERQTWPGVDPAISDHLAAEFGAAVSRILSMAKDMRSGRET
jgi:hypothetical protein